MCRSPELPDLYSHYGSRTIVVLAVLQSWAQGESCWGEQGMRKLWDASNVKIFAGGLVRLRLARVLAVQLGKAFEEAQVAYPLASFLLHPAAPRRKRRRVGRHPGGGQAAVSLSGTRRVIVQTVPWMRRPRRFSSGAVACPLRRAQTVTWGQASPNPHGAALGEPR